MVEKAWEEILAPEEGQNEDHDGGNDGDDNNSGGDDNNNVSDGGGDSEQTRNRLKTHRSVFP